ncbi:hypothetical protein BMT54_08945 [Pasteurellaceae bacterium 15-036681]|nr:hypothetical protein BMT54_08945 [Pasteurellaceae bacterium 15-036681]
MARFLVVFDETEKGYLKNSDASAHLVNDVDVESIEDVPLAIEEKIRKSDRYQIYSKNFKIKKIYESVDGELIKRKGAYENV